MQEKFMIFLSSSQNTIVSQKIITMKNKLLSFFKVDLRFMITSAVLIFLIANYRDTFFIKLSSGSFTKSVYIIDLLSKIPLFFLSVFGLLVLNYLPFKWNRFNRIWAWEKFDESGKLRILVMVLVFIMGWTYSTYEYNFYFDQAHYVERLLLILLIIGSWFSPLLVGPMIVIAYAVSTQMSHPSIVAYSYADKYVLFEILLLFALYAYIRPLTGTKYSPFIFVSLCIVGAFYYYPGEKKIAISTETISWVMDNDLHNLFLSSYINGWLSFLPISTALQITHIIQAINVPLQVITVIIEVAGLFIVLFKRRFAMLVLLGAVCLHTGIFFTSGIFFWKWITLDLALFWFLWRSRDDIAIQQIFQPLYGILAIFIIGYANLFGAIRLGWWDGPVNNYFDFEVVDIQGNVFEFPRYYMQPYDLSFTQSRLNYLVDDNLLANTYGTLHNSQMYSRLREEGYESIPDIKATLGRSKFHQVDIERITAFIEPYFENYNKHLDDWFILSTIRPPAHINTIPREGVYNNKYPIDIVRVWFTETYFDGSQVLTLQHQVVLEIEIPNDSLKTALD